MIVRMKIQTALVVIFAVMSTLALLCIPFVDVDSNGINGIMGYIVGAVFWIGIISEVICLLAMNTQRKKIEPTLNENDCKYHKNIVCGLISFFNGTLATTFDVMLFVSIIFIIITVWFEIRNAWIVLCGIAILFFSFNMHCLLNSKNYIFIKEYIKLTKEEKQYDKVQD